MAAVSPNPDLQDLKVTYQESNLVFPSQQTQERSLFLSNIDHFLNFYVPTLRFFPANPDFPPAIVAKRLKIALEKVLVPYDFIAGRLKWNPQLDRLEIDCNSAGAGFVVASSELSLDELGDLVCPNLGFQQLMARTLDVSATESDDQPLCVFQVTSFKCGGFAIGMSMNHILHDGLSAKAFQDNLASQAFEDKPLATIPYNNRHLLAARSPPLVTFPHPEFFKPDLKVLSPSDFDWNQELDFRIFKISSSDINFLKSKANEGRNNAATIKASTNNVVAALMWRCTALSCDIEHDTDRVSTLLNVVDLRSRLNPPLPPEFCGNAILVAYASAKCTDIEKWAFSKLVEMVSEGLTRVTDEYARSAIDWLEINRCGVPYGDYTMTSWLRLGFDQVEYPWGKPLCCIPVVNHLMNISWMLADADGVSVLVQRPAQEMQRFESHFLNFFAHNS